MYMVDYEGTMPIFAYAYLTHDRRWTGPRAYRITIYQDDTLMFRTFNEREEVLDTDFFYLVPGTAAKLTVQIEHEGWWMGTVPLSNLILKLDSFEWDWAKAQIFTPAYAPPETTAPTVPQKENVG